MKRTLSGILASLAGLAGYLFPAVRDAEELLPDFEQDAQTEEHTPQIPAPQNEETAPV